MSTKKNKIKRGSRVSSARFFELDEHAMEKANSLSETNPADTMTVQDIFDRFSTNKSTLVGDGFFSDDENIPDVSRMSKIQLAQFKKNINEAVTNLREQIAVNKKQKEQLAEQERIAQLAEKLIAERQKEQTELEEAKPE